MEEHEKTFIQKRIADHEQLCHGRNNGRILTSEELRLICAACGNNAEAIEKYIIELVSAMDPQNEKKKRRRYDGAFL